jgi:signal transduction histidine kinase
MPDGGTLAVEVAGVTLAAGDPRVDAGGAPGRWARIRVADSGSGIAATDLPRIFEPYYSTKASGTGLGLSIARRNVELHGGTIAVQSTRGVGTTVTIELPFTPPAA